MPRLRPGLGIDGVKVVRHAHRPVTGGAGRRARGTSLRGARVLALQRKPAQELSFTVDKVAKSLDGVTTVARILAVVHRDAVTGAMRIEHLEYLP